MLEISHNSTSIARGCWQKYRYNYIDQIQPKVKSRALHLGKTVHEAFEQYYTGTTDSDVLNNIAVSYDKTLSTCTVDETETVTIDKYTAMGMWAFYPHKDLTEFEECHTEVEFSVPLTGKRGVRFVGRVDGLVKKDGVWWCREVKTTGLTPRQFEGRCGTSAQATGYVYALKRMGYDVKGVMFDVIKKPLLRKRQSEDCDEFGKRIFQDYLEDSKKPQKERKAYLRHYEYRPDYKIKQWLDSQQSLVNDIRAKKRNDSWFRNMDSCWSWGSLCPYAKICHMERPDDLTMEMYYEKRRRD